jgi:hypothetical protein
MDYFEYKYVLVGFLMLFYVVYSLIIIIKRYGFKMKSMQIIRIPISRNSMQSLFLIILTYLITLPIFTYYFGKVLRLLYCQFVVTEDYYLRRQGFFLDDYDSKHIAWVVLFYFFLIVKLIFSFIIRNYTIRKDNFIIITLFTFMVFLQAWGNGNDIRTYSHFILTGLFFLSMYFVIRNKVSKYFFKEYYFPS